MHYEVDLVITRKLTVQVEAHSAQEAEELALRVPELDNGTDEQPRHADGVNGWQEVASEAVVNNIRQKGFFE